MPVWALVMNYNTKERCEIMADNNCPYHALHERKIEEHGEKLNELDDRVTDLDKNTAVMQERIFSTLDNLAKLPETMTAIKDTMVTMQVEISSSNSKIQSLDEKVNSLKTKVYEYDEEGQINVRKGFWKWVKSNWILVGSAFATLIYWGGNVIKDVFK